MDISKLEAEEKAFEKMMDQMICAYGEELSALNKRLKEDPLAAVPEDVHARCIVFINSLFGNS